MLKSLLFRYLSQSASRSRRGRKRGARGKLRKGQEIDRVHVDKPFDLHLPDHVVEGGERKAGEGCYISTTIQNRRYYGVLVDQAALKAASMLHFQNEAAGLDLNRKIEQLKQQLKFEQDESLGERKRPAETEESADPAKDNKRMRLEDDSEKAASEKKNAHDGMLTLPRTCGRPVQKFGFVDPVPAPGRTPATPGYRVLLATYADATVAAEKDPEKAKLIEAACRAGGDFVGPHYFFKYEVCVMNETPTSLQSGMSYHTCFPFLSDPLAHRIEQNFKSSVLQPQQQSR